MIRRRIVRCNAKRTQYGRDRIDILERRYVMECTDTAAAKQRRRDDGQYGIFRAADLHAPTQRVPSMNDQLFHSPSSSYAAIPLL